MLGSMIAKGSRVEVSSDEEGLKDAWYLATVVDLTHFSPKNKSKKGTKNIGYVIRYDTLYEEEDSSAPLMETVDASFVRPLPPPYPGGGGVVFDFQLYDVVDAYHRDGWWTGVVSKVVVDGDVKRYRVFFETPPEEFEFQTSDLRLHLDWVDPGRWVPRKKKIPQQAVSDKNGIQTSNSDNGVTPAKGALTINHSENPTLGAKDKNPSSEKSEVGGKVVNVLEGSLRTGGDKRPSDSVEEILSAKRFQPSSGNNGNTEDINSGNTSCKSPLHQEPLVVEKEIITTESGEVKGRKSQHRRKKGKPQKLPFKTQTDFPQDTQELEKMNGSEPHQMAMDDVDGGALSMCYQGMHPPTLSNNSSALDHNTPIAANNNRLEISEELPFAKSSPIWATIESLELYHTPPQNPHFSPLTKVKKDFREGFAIGQMVTYANVVEKTSRMNLSDPIDVIESSLETLSELETHGFVVDALRCRLKRLLCLKAKIGRLEEERQKAEAEVAAVNVKQAAVEAEMGGIKAEMSKLQEKFDEAVGVKQKVLKEIGLLKSKVNLFSDHMAEAKLEFEELAATPL